MSLSNTVSGPASTLCSTPGGYVVQMMSLLQKLLYSGRMPSATVLLFSLLALLIVMLLPATFYWQYRSRLWWQLAVGVVAFVVTQDYSMLQDKADIGPSFLGTTVLFGLLYLPLLVWWQGSRYLAGRVAGRRINELPLAWHEWLVLLVLAAVVHLIFFVVFHALDLMSSDVLRAGSNVVNCLLYLAQPFKAEAYRDVFNMLLATLPALTLAILLAACFATERRQ